LALREAELDPPLSSRVCIAGTVGGSSALLVPKPPDLGEGVGENPEPGVGDAAEFADGEIVESESSPELRPT